MQMRGLRYISASWFTSFPLPVLPVPWLAPGLTFSFGEHSQELLSVHGTRHQDRPFDR